MQLDETTFDQFVSWCEENKKHWHTEREYITVSKLRIIYDYCVKHNLECKGRKCTLTWKNREWIGSLSAPLEQEPTKEELIWDLFHEVWCKAEWVIRCTKTDQELGYDSVKTNFGINIIKQIREAT